MQSLLAAIAAGTAFLGLAYAFFAARGIPHAPMEDRDHSALGGALGLSAVLAAALFAGCLPTREPFAPGLTLGWGILAGTVTGLYALLSTGRSVDGDPRFARLVGVLSAAALGPSALLLVFRGYPNEALMGCALGALLVAGVAHVLLRSEGSSPVSSRGAALHGLATAAVVVGTRLGIEHFPRSEPGALAGGYWAVPALMLAVGALVLALLPGSWSGRPARRGATVAGFLGGAASLATVALLQARLLRELRWETAAMGLVLFAFIAWMLSREDVEENPDSRPVLLAFGSGLLALGLVALAFRLLQGYGLVLALAPGLLVLGAPYMAADRQKASLAEPVGMGAATIVLLWAAQRLFLERAGRGFALDFQEHYNLLSLLAGAGMCFALLTLLSNPDTTGTKRIGKAVALGLLFAAAPLALAALWGAKATGAYLAGLIVAETLWMALAAWSRGPEHLGALATAPDVFIAGSAIVAAQLAPAVLAMDIARNHRLIMVGAAAVAALLWIIADAFAQPRAGTEGARHEAGA